MDKYCTQTYYMSKILLILNENLYDKYMPENFNINNYSLSKIQYEHTLFPKVWQSKYLVVVVCHI